MKRKRPVHQANLKGFTLTEVLIGTGVFSIFAAGFFGSLLSYNTVVEQNYRRASAVEIIDDTFKTMRASDYADLRDAVFGAESSAENASDSATDSSSTTLFSDIADRYLNENGEEEFEISVSGAPSAQHSNLVSEEMVVTVSVSWELRGRSKSMERSSTFFNFGIIQ